METIKIEDGKVKITLHINGERISGYKFVNNQYEKDFNASVYDYFKLLLLSDNYIELASGNGYQVFLDKETNFKHYIKNNQESLEMFFKNNGYNAILYLEKNDVTKNAKTKIFTILKKNGKTIRITLSLAALTMLFALGLTSSMTVPSQEAEITPSPVATSSFIETPKITIAPVTKTPEVVPAKEDTLPVIEPEDIIITPAVTLEEAKERIYSSELEEKEKNFLYNEEFFNDLLPTINSTEYARHTIYSERFYDLHIKGYGPDDPNYKYAGGYYDAINDPQSLYVANYNDLDYGHNKPIVSHEFGHLFQVELSSNLLSEPCAEIISAEYFLGTDVNNYQDATYQDGINFVKKLMEIIGSKPIWDYLFAGDFSKIEARTKPYLNDKDYAFLEYNLKDIQYPWVRPDFSKLDKILNTLHKNIYGQNMHYNQAIVTYLTENQRFNTRKMTRYYFNSNYITPEYSYYTVEGQEEFRLFLEDAMRLNKIYLYAKVKTPLTIEEYEKTKDDPNVYSYGEINHNGDNGIPVYQDENGESVYYFSEGDEYFESKDYYEVQDYMIKKGYGQYVKAEFNRITYSDYVTGHYYANDGVIDVYNANSNAVFWDRETNLVTCLVKTGEILEKQDLPTMADIEDYWYNLELNR